MKEKSPIPREIGLFCAFYRINLQNYYIIFYMRSRYNDKINI